MKKLIYTLALLSLISCDCYRVTSGKVVDKTTLEPIKGVKVCFYDQPKTFSYTDSLGNYSINYVKWGIGCYTKDDKKVIAEKKSYKKSDVVPAMNTIELEQELKPEKVK